MSKLGNIIDKLLFPKDIKCVICGDDLNIDKRYNVCDKCIAQLPFIKGKVCAKCGAPISDMGKVCINCKNAGHSFQANYSCFTYDYPISTLVRDLKFNNKKYLANTLGGFIATKVIEIGKNFDIVIPVPMHEKALKQRGYNQSELLCGELVKLGYNVKTDVLVKKENTKPQVGLEKEERLKNLENVFKVEDRKSVKGKVILLVDDVITTGTTLDECAHALIKAGALKVYAVTLCHA